MSSPNQTIPAAALKLAAAGIRSFPLRPDKTPACARGFYAASADPVEMAALWQHCPGALPGTPTGRINGFDCLDLDFVRHPESKLWYEQNKHRLPDTRTHLSRSFGWHMLFKSSDLVHGTASKIHKGVDTRGRGGYICWWPAADLPVLSNAPIAAWPQWLLDELKPKPRPRCPGVKRFSCTGIGELSGPICTVIRAVEGQRNSILFWAACRAGEAVRDGVVDEATIEQVLIHAAARCGLDHTEAEKTVRSGLLRGYSDV
jgi:hypothetical protein